MDLVVNLGDIIQDTNDKQRDLTALSYMFGRLKEFPAPVVSVLGNHDLRMMDRISEVSVLMGQEKTTFSMDLDGYHLVFLTPMLRPELGTLRGGSYKTQHVSAETLLWLEEDLNLTRLPVLIFTHFPLADDPRVPDECMFLKNRAAVTNILYKSQKVKAALIGHQHTPRFVEENGLPYYIVGSPTASLKEDGIPIGVFRMIETEGDDLRITERRVQV